MSDQKSQEKLVAMWNRGIMGLKLNCVCFVLLICAGTSGAIYLVHTNFRAMLFSLQRQDLSVAKAIILAGAALAILLAVLALVAIPLSSLSAARRLRALGYTGTFCLRGRKCTILQTAWGRIDTPGIVKATWQPFFPHNLERSIPFSQKFEVRIRENLINPGAKSSARIVFKLEVISGAEAELCKAFPGGPDELAGKISEFFGRWGASDIYAGKGRDPYPSGLRHCGIFVENQWLFRVASIERDHEPN